MYTSSDSSFASSAYIHPSTAKMVPSQLLGLGVLEIIQIFFALVLQCICLGLSFDWLPDIYNVCIYLLSIELHDDCQMLWVWPEEHFGLANCIMLGIGHHMNAENAFSREHWNTVNTITKKIKCASVAESPCSIWYLKSWKSTTSCFDIYRCN